ncbi:DUF697 domain-containing protein [Parvularcula sp. LCG005]|uniref:DUF697 domain-containing protein n=1 Tax=Parvularcula sp. LCG005 TaxID=3078805 RepID=UPI002942FAC0|nr:DUF697 domain-containing protein [Parvularcula sp. LCG005]WOI53848.1 DUF697 domain-containing protein [Parvularcula sp. LCG005]
MPTTSKQRAPDAPPPSAPEAKLPEPVPVEEDRWEISAQWKRAWRAIKWTAYGALTLTALLIVGQIYLFASLFAGIHPVLGGIFVGLVSAALVFFVVRPLWRFMRMPSVAIPPDVELHDPALTHHDVERRIAYDLTYLRNMQSNPALSGHGKAIAEAIADLEALSQREHDLTPRVAGEEIGQFEARRILPLLNDLDKEVDAYIRKEALGVATATAVSLNGTVDAFVVLWRNVNMISRIGRLYYGRPSLRLSMKIIGDVSMSVVLSRVADDLTETAGHTMGGVMNRVGGIVAGPVMDGSVNALVTLKLGYAAKRRCRSFDVWSRRRATQVAAEVLEQVRKESGGLISDFLKLVGGAGGLAIDVAQKAWTAPRSAWSMVQNTVGKRTSRKPTEETP